MLKARRTLALVRGILIVGTVGSFGLTAGGFCQTPTAPSPPQSATASPASVPTPATATSPAPDDVEKRDLDLGKLRAEIQKLQADTKKAEADTKKANWDWIGPLVSVITIAVLAATLVSQRKTALDVQEKQSAASLQLQQKQGQAALELQKAQNSAALEIKVIDLVMSSRSPALARGRAELLGHLYTEEARSAFLDAVKTMTLRREFPGDLGFELRTKVFTELASKYKEPADVALLARRIFSGDDWLKEELVPSKPAPTLHTQNS
jgi:hypothetical protein